MVILEKKDLFEYGINSSKGNQLKWKKEGFWYKADYAGYEGLTEYMVSRLLAYSDLKPEEYVLYDTEEIHYGEAVLRGCKSRDFLKPGQQLITLERLMKTVTGESMYQIIWKMPEEERAEGILSKLREISGISNYQRSFVQMMAVDAVFLNEDRHMHNIALIEEGDEYTAAPIFDNGAGLLSDTTLDYPAGGDIFRLIGKCRAKTFSDDFSKQLEAAEKLCGKGPRFHFGHREIQDLLEKEPFYPAEMKQRVEEILLEQKRRYAYMFD